MMPRPATRRLCTLAQTLLLASLLPVAPNLHGADLPEIREVARPGDLALVADGKAADILWDTNDFKVVGIAAALLRDDIERVTGVQVPLDAGSETAVIVGSLDGSALIREISTNGLDFNGLRDKWESFHMEVINDPLPRTHPHLKRALVIAGSDRRGTAYGVFELSRALGVSPWYWWADVPPTPHTNLFVSAHSVHQGPPSVRYRGIFINDEDWGLQPWAGKTFEPETGDIGPRTYAKIFELLLRLKANYCWPAMHDCTKAFNSFPLNKQVADDFAIVMGSSHCEPLLCNNVTEWDHDRFGDWNYVTNSEQIRRYWEARLATNARFENVYTVGMRGIHDSGMPGGGTLAEKARRLERVIADQREIIARYTGRDASEIPQIFCPYKEVLNIYRSGMTLPDDVTIVWADDNHGYIRQLSNPSEQQRAGRAGVYYHLSYWGAPQDYLWLCSTSPSLIFLEMSKAFHYGADRLWVFNVGDIKPAEKELTFAMDLAWNIERWTPERALEFPTEWAGNVFGERWAEPVGRVLNEYYRLAQRGKPEHIDHVQFSPRERERRLDDYRRIADQAMAIRDQLPARLKDAYFQLVEYPVRGAALMNEKHLLAEESRELARHGNARALAFAEQATRAYEEIQRLTRAYNEEVANGKWRHMMDWHPRRRPVFDMPVVATEEDLSEGRSVIEIDLARGHYTAPMAVHDGVLQGTSPEVFRDSPGGAAVFRFDSPLARTLPLWALANTPSPEEDSWHLQVNETRAVANDQVTDGQWRWIQLGEYQLRQGANTLTIGQREPNAQIKALQFGAPAQTVADPLRFIAGADFAGSAETADAHIVRLPGFGAGAVTIEPVTAPSVTAQEAASVRYEAMLPPGPRTARFCFLPTAAIHEGRGLRAVVRINEGEATELNLHAEEYTREWGANVLRGYSARTVSFQQPPGQPTSVEVRFPDPGLVLLGIEFD